MPHILEVFAECLAIFFTYLPLNEKGVETISLAKYVPIHLSFFILYCSKKCFVLFESKYNQWHQNSYSWLQKQIANAI